MDSGPRIIAIITRLYSPIDLTVTADSRLVDDLEMDSMDLVEMVMEIEDTFSIEFTNEECNGFRTVGDVINAVNTKKWWV